MKGKAHTIISINAEKPLTNSTSFHDKNNQQTRNTRKLSQYSEGHIWKTHSKHEIEWWRWKAFPLRSGTGQGYMLSPLLFNITLEVLGRGISQERNKRHHKWKGKSKIIFVCRNMILYVENYKDAMQCNCWTEFTKAAGYKVNIGKSVAFLYTNNK